MKILKPTQIFSAEKVIFLAGPIQGAPDWQGQIINYFETNYPDSDLTIASPRRYDVSHDFIYKEQVNWETTYLNMAANYGSIIFWLAEQNEHVPGRAYAQTTRYELAEWITKYKYENVKLIIGIEDGFSGEKYIRCRLEKENPEIKIYNSLNQIIEQIKFHHLIK